MSFLGLIAKNLFRDRVSAVLTLVGITLGITTVVALGAVTAERWPPTPNGARPLSDSAGLVHDNERRWRTFRARVDQLVASERP